MGQAAAKTELIVQPVQSGKTRRVFDIIKVAHFLNPDRVNVIFHSNNIGLGHQLSTRLQNDNVLKTCGRVLIWNSGAVPVQADPDPDAPIITNESPGEVARFIVEQRVAFVLCCDNPRRWTSVRDLVTFLGRLRQVLPMSLFIDEADARITFQNYDAFAGGEPMIEHIYLITATPERLLRDYPDGIPVAIDMKPVTDANYVGVADQDWLLLAGDAGAAADAYVAYALEHPDVARRLLPGTRWFVPGSVARQSHDSIANLFLARGCHVLVINGEHREMRRPHGQAVQAIADTPGAASTELSAVLADWWNADAELRATPLIVTGHICLSRGISIQDGMGGRFLFDVSIIAPKRNRDEAYQMVGRVLGGFGHVRGRHRALIVTTPDMQMVAAQGERISIEINTAAHERDDRKVYAADVKRIRKGHPVSTLRLVNGQFGSFEAACAFAKSRWPDQRPTLARRKRRADGHYIAPVELQQDGENPTFEHVLQRGRKWGLDPQKASCRLCPLREAGHWAVVGYAERPLA